jgi:hypothetical protein
MMRLFRAIISFDRKRQLVARFPAARVMVQADGHGPGNGFADR